MAEPITLAVEKSQRLARRELKSPAVAASICPSHHPASDGTFRRTVRHIPCPAPPFAVRDSAAAISAIQPATESAFLAELNLPAGTSRNKCNRPVSSAANAGPSLQPAHPDRTAQKAGSARDWVGGFPGRRTAAVAVSSFLFLDGDRRDACPTVAKVALVMMMLVSLSNNRRRRKSATSTGAALSARFLCALPLRSTQ